MAKALRHISLPALGIALGILLLASGCSNIVLPDKEDLYALRSANGTEKELSVEGKVEGDDGSPLQGISVQIIGMLSIDPQNYYNYRELTSVSTDVSGIYKMPRTTVYPAFTNLKIIASDSRGIYVPDSVVVNNARVGSIAPTIILKKR